jgi:hypothetical protein
MWTKFLCSLLLLVTVQAFAATSTYTNVVANLSDSSLTGGNPLARRVDGKYAAVAQNPGTRAENAFWASALQAQWLTASQWIDTTFTFPNWTNSSGWTVTNSHVFPTNSNGANGMRPWPVFTNETSQVVGYFNVPNSPLYPAVMYNWIAVNTNKNDDNTGAFSPSPGNGMGSFGIGIYYAGSGSQLKAMVISNGTQIILTNVLPLGADYRATITVDAQNISLSLTDTNAAHTIEALAVTARGARWSSISNIQIFVGDPRSPTNTAAISVFNVAARKGLTTWNPSPFIAGDRAATVVWTRDASNHYVRVLIPRDHDTRVPARLLYHSHGTDGNRERASWADTTARAYFENIVSNATIVVGSDEGSDANYGNDEAQFAARDAINFVRTNWSVAGIFGIGESAGGVTPWGIASRGWFKFDGLIGIYPVLDLFGMFTNTAYTAGSNFIYTAYGLTNANDFTNRTTVNGEHNPVAKHPSAYAGTPMLMFGSTADGAVPPTSHAHRMTNAVTGWNNETTFTATTGGHGDASNWDVSAVLAFMGRNSLAGGATPPGVPKFVGSDANVTNVTAATVTLTTNGVTGPTLRGLTGGDVLATNSGGTAANVIAGNINATSVNLNGNAQRMIAGQGSGGNGISFNYNSGINLFLGTSTGGGLGGVITDGSARYAWASGSLASSSTDTGIGRSGAGTNVFGTTANTPAGTINASNLVLYGVFSLRNQSALAATISANQATWAANIGANNNLTLVSNAIEYTYYTTDGTTLTTVKRY